MCTNNIYLHGEKNEKYDHFLVEKIALSGAMIRLSMVKHI